VQALGQVAVVRRQVAAADPVPLTATLFNLAWLLADLEDFAAAEVKFKEVVALRLKQAGADSREVAVARMGLAAVYLAQGKYLAALEPYGQATAVLRKMEGVKGLAESIDQFQRGLLARRLPSWSSGVFGKTGLQEAERCLRQSLALARKAVGDRHAYVALVLFELGEVLEDSHRDAEAEQVYRDCLQIVRVYGLEHPKAGIVLNHFCPLLQRRGKAAEARLLAEEALQKRLARYGPDHPLVAESRLTAARLYNRPEERPRREQLLREAVDGFRRAGGPPRRVFPVCLNQLAITLVASGRSAEAEPLLREALPLARKTFADHPSMPAIMQTNLAVTLLDQHKNEEVEALVREALALAAQEPGEPGAACGAWRCLGRLYRETRQPAKAADAALQLRAVRGAGQWDLYHAACQLGWCADCLAEESAERGKYAEQAMVTLRRAKAAGFRDANRLRREPDLAVLRGRPDFQQLIEEMAKPRAATGPKKAT
jgi:tetratricopeptide (TPR) repeat protein